MAKTSQQKLHQEKHAMIFLKGQITWGATTVLR
jgi:hypothetical protein